MCIGWSLSSLILEVESPHHFGVKSSVTLLLVPFNRCLNAMVTLAHKRAPRRPLEAITVTCPTCRRSQPHGQYAKHAPRNRTLESVVDGWLKSEDRRKHLIPKVFCNFNVTIISTLST